MNRAIPGYSNVLAMRAIEGPYLVLVANRDGAVEDQTRELAEADTEWEAPMIIDAQPEDFGETVKAPAPDWRYPARDCYFEKPSKADRFPVLAPQEPVDDGGPKLITLVLMFAGVGLMGLIWGSGDLLVRLLIAAATWAIGAV